MKKVKNNIITILILVSIVVGSMSFIFSGPDMSYAANPVEKHDILIQYLVNTMGDIRYLSNNKAVFTFPHAKRYVTAFELFTLFKKNESLSNYTAEEDDYNNYYNYAENRETIYPYNIGPNTGRIDTGFSTTYKKYVDHPYAIHTSSGLDWTYWDGNYPYYPDTIGLTSHWVAHGIDIRQPSVGFGYPFNVSVSYNLTTANVTISQGYSSKNVRAIYFRYGEDNGGQITFYGKVWSIEQSTTGSFSFIDNYGSAYPHQISASRTVYTS